VFCNSVDSFRCSEEGAVFCNSVDSFCRKTATKATATAHRESRSPLAHARRWWRRQAAAGPRKIQLRVVKAGTCRGGGCGSCHPPSLCACTRPDGGRRGGGCGGGWRGCCRGTYTSRRAVEAAAAALASGEVEAAVPAPVEMEAAAPPPGEAAAAVVEATAVAPASVEDAAAAPASLEAARRESVT